MPFNSKANLTNILLESYFFSVHTIAADPAVQLIYQ